MNDPKDKKKISPDSTDDETTKKYHDEDIMEAVFGDDDDDNEVLLGEGEVPADDFDKLNTQKKKKKKAESKEEIEDEDVDDTEEEIQEEEEDVDDEDVEEAEEKEVKSKKKKEEKEELVQLKVTEEVVDALKPYKGNINERINELIKAYKAATSKLSSYGHAQKVIEEIGIADKTQDEIIGVFKDLKSAYYDFLVNPEVLNVIESFAKGEVPKGFESKNKTVQEFMPEDEFYSHEEAMNDFNSNSYKAYEQWEQDRERVKAERRKLLDSISKHKGELDANPKSVVLKTLNDKFATVKQFAKDEFDMDDQTYNEFVREFKELPVEAIKIALAMHARKNGIDSVKAKKLSKNKSKSFVESIVEDAQVPKRGDRFEQEKDKEKYYASGFKDWDTDDNAIY